MKRVLFLFAFIMMGGLVANAQCTKSAEGKACCMAKKTASTDGKACANMAVASAESDAAAEKAGLQRRVCEGTNKVCYYEKSVAADKTVTWNEVSYNSADKKFTKVASASMERVDGKAVTTPACSKDSKKACCAAKKEGTK